MTSLICGSDALSEVALIRVSQWDRIVYANTAPA